MIYQPFCVLLDKLGKIYAVNTYVNVKKDAANIGIILFLRVLRNFLLVIWTTRTRLIFVINMEKYLK